MKLSWVKALILTGAASISATASAADTNWIQILKLEALSDGSGGLMGYSIYTDGSMLNPAGCANNDYAEMDTTAHAEERDMMNKTALGAFLAGRKVKLRISGNSGQCGPTGRPRYYMVQLSAEQ